MEPIDHHCQQCILNQEEVGKLGERVILFLQVEDVLALGHMHPDMQQKIEDALRSNDVKGKEEESELEWRIAESKFLDPEVVGHLMDLIQLIEQVGIVIIGNWMHDGTTEEVCQQMFSHAPFQPFLIGSAADGWTIPDRIENWCKTHEVGQYLVLMEKDRAEVDFYEGNDRVLPIQEGIGISDQIENAIKILEKNGFVL